MEPGQVRPRAIARATKFPMAPRKVRRVVDLIRGLPVDQALSLLRFARYAAAEPVAKVLASAIANAEHNFDLDPDTLVISHASVDEGGRPIRGPRHRIRPRAQGRAYKERLRTSHITVEVESRPANDQRVRRTGAKGRTR